MNSEKPLISIVTPCFNEEENVDELYRRIKLAISGIEKYDFELIFIDNHSEDNTVEKIKVLAANDYAVKIIVNTRNFGHIRSPYYAILQSRGVATIYLASDLQDPPEMIPEFISEWESGYKLVMAVKPNSEGPALVHYLRKSYYKLLDGISDISVVNNSTGFGLYDQVVLNQLRALDEPYPFLRGLICELGYTIKTIPFVQPRRLAGITKNNFYTLYDIAMLGIISHSKLPIRIAAFVGFLLGSVSMLVGIVFTILKLIYWDAFPWGMAPIVVGLFFLLGIQLMFIGVLGEYVASIHTYQQKRPLVVEKERVNF
ncbi:glycosyltransferase family 2 protein [Gammaproteobacteria bacterium]|jgi:glycosyltransferase involved in cell wall biosynthesis|nr:glycosyltransferase family 2 protein [Gammaproteobacteria bacterium]